MLANVKVMLLRPLAMGFGFYCALAAQAQDVTQVSTNYYTVSGNTMRELRWALNQSRPWKDHRPADAMTDWNIHWTYQVVPTETGCQLKSMTTRTTISITLPKWVPGPDASPQLAEQWDRYLKALLKHEEGHRTIAHAAAAEMRKRIQAFEEASTCEALAAGIKKTAQDTLSEYRGKEARYDRETENGASQGARFP